MDLSFSGINQNVLGRNTWPPENIKGHWAYVHALNNLAGGNELELEATSTYYGLRGSAPYISFPFGHMIASTNASFLFGEPPKVLHDDEADNIRLQQIIKLNKLPQRCRAAAKSSSVGGGVYGWVLVDDSSELGRKVPIIRFLEETEVIPTFSYGELVEATIVKEWPRNGDIYRLLSHHTAGLITNTLYKSDSKSNQGKEISLDSFKETKGLLPEIQTGLDELLIVYIPNDITTGSDFGKSDIAGLEALLLAMDEVLSSGHETVQSATPITFMDKTLATERGSIPQGKNMILVDNAAGDIEAQIKDKFQTIQFNIQAGEFKDWFQHLLLLTSIACSLSPEAFGIFPQTGRAESGTALRLKMAATLSMIAGKSRFWTEGLAHLLRLAALLDTQPRGDKPAFSWNKPDELPSVELADGTPLDMTEISAVVVMLVKAGVLSVETAVRMVHPDWSDDQVDQELEEIKAGTSSIETGFQEALASSLGTSSVIGE